MREEREEERRNERGEERKGREGEEVRKGERIGEEHVKMPHRT